MKINRGLVNQLSVRALILIYLPLTLLLFALLFFGYILEKDRALEILHTEDSHQVELQYQLLENEINSLYTDLAFISDLFVQNYEATFSGDAAKAFQSFLSNKNQYDQIRFIDKDGMERIRVEYKNNVPTIADSSVLQDKSNRYYFQGTIKLKDNEIYTSRFDLNVEQGEIEQPLKPTLRLATPTFDDDGNMLGIIVINYLGNYLFNKMQDAQASHERELMLINQDGYWLFNQNNYKNWGFMFPDGKSWTFGNKFKEAWPKLSGKEAGYLTINEGNFIWKSFTPSGTMKTANLDPDASNLEYWKILIHRSPQFIEAFYSRIQLKYLVSSVVLALFTIIIFLVIEHYRARQKDAEVKRALLQEARVFTTHLLESALSPQSLEKELENALEMILSLSWLSILAKGSIFLTDEKTGELVMTVQKDLSTPLLSLCARLQPGQCLCGRAALNKEIVFKNCLDHDHEIRFDGITQHGHICAPILEGDKVLGVLNLYVEHGHQYNPLYEDLLNTITKALASLIERKKTDEELVQAHLEVKKQHSELVYERNIVEETLLKIRSSEAFDPEGIRYLMAAVEKTAGDLLLSARRNDGMHHYLLGDFTGHGLPSALSGPTVADIFYAMTHKGISACDILKEINNKLTDTLPTHLYFAACFIEFNPQNMHFNLWVAGLPDAVLFRDGLPIEHFESTLLPLGITKGIKFSENTHEIDATHGDRLYAFTDGVIEAHNIEEEMFGRDRFEQLLSKIISDDSPLDAILETITEYTDGDEQADDITVLEVQV